MLIRYVHHSFSLFPSPCSCIDERHTDPTQLMLRARRLRRSAHRQFLRFPPVQPPIRRTPGGRLVRGAREVADGVVERGAVWPDHRFDQCVFFSFSSCHDAGRPAWTEGRLIRGEWESERGRGGRVNIEEGRMKGITVSQGIRHLDITHTSPEGTTRRGLFSACPSSVPISSAVQTDQNSLRLPRRAYRLPLRLHPLPSLAVRYYCPLFRCSVVAHVVGG